MAVKANSFPLVPGKSLNGAVQAVKSFLASEQKMEVQVLKMEDGATLIQARSVGGKWKQIVGMDKVISVKFSNKGQNILFVEIGGGKWIDKGLVAGISLIVLWPLTVTSGIGMYNQAKLPEKILSCIRDYLDIP